MAFLPLAGLCLASVLSLVYIVVCLGAPDQVCWVDAISLATEVPHIGMLLTRRGAMHHPAKDLVHIESPCRQLARWGGTWSAANMCGGCFAPAHHAAPHDPGMFL